MSTNTFRYVHVDELRTNPHNVRGDLGLDKPFLGSIAANGVRQPLQVINTDGTLTVIAGHRRLAAAIAAGLDEVPCVIETADGREAWHDFLDQYNENHHRRDLTAQEEADALFAAVEAGASKAKVAKRTGVVRRTVDQAVSAAALSPDARTAAQQSGHAWDLTELAALAEFDADPEASARLVRAAESGHFWYRVERERIEREERQAIQAAAERLAGDGVRVLGKDEEARRVASLVTSTGEPISADAHQQCPGHAVKVLSGDPSDVTAYCTDPAGNGHLVRGDRPQRTDAGRHRDAMVRAGNKAWRAARKQRRAFVSELIARRTAPPQVAEFTARALLTTPTPVRKWAGGGQHAELAELLGVEEDRARLVEQATAKRMPLLAFAAIAAAYEKAIDDNAWRTEELLPNPWHRETVELMHEPLTEWFGLLRDLGYALSPIECAIAEGRTWDPAEEA